MTIETATPDTGAQDIESRLEGVLYPSEDELDETNDDEGLDDADLDDQLPDDTDSDSDDEEGSDDDDIDNDDDLEDEELTLAGYLGVDDDRIQVDDEGNVSLNAIIDGETKAVDLKELVSSYQLQGHVNNQSVALGNERKEFDETRAQAFVAIQEKVQGLDALGKALEQQLVEDFESVDWERIRVDNPAEWSALQQEFTQRAQKVNQAQNLILQQNQQTTAEQQQASEAQFQKHLQGELDKMIKANPEWADETKRSAAQVDIRNFMTSTYGFTEQDMSSVYDSKIIQVIQDAKAFREGKKTAEGKKGKKVPQFKKPGVSRKNAKSLAKARDAKSKIAKVKKTGHVNDVATLLESRM